MFTLGWMSKKDAGLSNWREPWPFSKSIESGYRDSGVWRYSLQPHAWEKILVEKRIQAVGIRLMMDRNSGLAGSFQRLTDLPR